MTRQQAIFLDRDGTLVHPFPYPSRPEHLQLYEDIGPALRTLQQMGFLLIVVTNQSGIARGYFSEKDLDLLHKHLQTELAMWDVQLDAIYHCPHHPDGIITQLAIRCGCRKPQSGMLLRAASDCDLDLSSSWLVGDILDDVEAGNRVGCRTVLVDLGTEQLPQSVQRVPTFVAQSTSHALHIIQTMVSQESTNTRLDYRPASWQVDKGVGIFSGKDNACSR